jgi:hypothetical protein
MTAKRELAFRSHLERIRFAKKTTSLLEQTTLAEKSMGLLWEHLFDYLCLDNQGPDWAIVKELATILNKLMRNYQQLRTLSNIKGVKEQQPWRLSADMLKEIEDQLQLL